MDQFFARIPFTRVPGVTMLTRNDIVERLQERYNDALIVYDYGSHIRLTNGSAAWFLDIRVFEDEIHVVGELRGRGVDTRCDRQIESLTTVLDNTI